MNVEKSTKIRTMMKQRRSNFSEEFKRKVAAEVVSGSLSKEEARRVYDIRGKSAVTDWVRYYGSTLWGDPAATIALQAMSKEQHSVEELLRKITLLQEQLQQEKNRAGLYETMLTLAEQQLKIPIRKKFGAKRWNSTKPQQGK